MISGPVRRIEKLSVSHIIISRFDMFLFLSHCEKLLIGHSKILTASYMELWVYAAQLTSIIPDYIYCKCFAQSAGPWYLAADIILPE